jgi:hypothetical protein
VLAGGRYRNPAMGPSPASWGDTAAQRIVGAWSESSLSIHAMCAARGIRYLHVLQPTLHDVGSKVLTPEEVESGKASEVWVRAVHDGYPLLRESGARLAARGIAFVDLSGIFRDLAEPTYYDMCHFRGRGAELFAERTVRELLALLPAEVPRRERATRR